MKNLLQNLFKKKAKEAEITAPVQGNKSDKIRELNPAIVVITVKKQGLIICNTVSKSSCFG